MKPQNKSCKAYQTLLVKYVDDALTPEEQRRLEEHVQQCPACRHDLKEFEKIKGVKPVMKKRFLPDMLWEEYWNHLYNRLERGIAWILISLGAIILLGMGVFHFVTEVLEASDLSTLEKAGILALTAGFVVLFVSVVREKLMIRKHDKYKEILR